MMGHRLHKTIKRALLQFKLIKYWFISLNGDQTNKRYFNLF